MPGKPLKMLKKNVYSRTCHQTVNKSLAEGMSEDDAKEQGREAGGKAVAALPAEQ